MTVEVVSDVLAPAMMPACCTVRTRASTWSLVAPTSRAASAKRAKAPALSETATPVCCESR
jgi:hypothetical protein